MEKHRYYFFYLKIVIDHANDVYSLKLRSITDNFVIGNINKEEIFTIYISN